MKYGCLTAKVTLNHQSEQRQLIAIMLMYGVHITVCSFDVSAYYRHNTFFLSKHYCLLKGWQDNGQL